MKRSQLMQNAFSELSTSEKSQTLSDQIFAAQYQLYLPSKDELKQKLLDWIAEQETLDKTL